MRHFGPPSSPPAHFSALLFVLLPAAALNQSPFSSHLFPFNFFQSEIPLPLGGRRWGLVEHKWMQHARSILSLEQQQYMLSPVVHPSIVTTL